MCRKAARTGLWGSGEETNRSTRNMQSPDGIIYPMIGHFQEIRVPERLVFTSAALNNEGNQLFEVFTTVVFTEIGRQTKIDMFTCLGKVTPEGKHYVQGQEEGWKQSFDRLKCHLKKTEVIQ